MIYLLMNWHPRNKINNIKILFSFVRRHHSLWFISFIIQHLHIFDLMKISIWYFRKWYIFHNPIIFCYESSEKFHNPIIFCIDKLRILKCFIMPSWIITIQAYIWNIWIFECKDSLPKIIGLLNICVWTYMKLPSSTK